MLVVAVVLAVAVELAVTDYLCREKRLVLIPRLKIFFLFKYLQIIPLPLEAAVLQVQLGPVRHSALLHH
jgi:hypothetical protein